MQSEDGGRVLVSCLTSPRDDDKCICLSLVPSCEASRVLLEGRGSSSSSVLSMLSAQSGGD